MKQNHLTVLFNFTVRCIVLIILGLILYPSDIGRALYLGIAVSAGLAIFDIIFGSAEDPHKQGRRVTQVIAGQGLVTKKDKIGWVLLMILLPAGNLILVVTLLSIFTTELWIWLVGVLVALATFAFAPSIARRLLK